ncbi:MAG: hypothetical protein L0H64_02440 [Pseudonocardia sp.]|nr:hypothetical protein [Pseudonocardia sp.]
MITTHPYRPPARHPARRRLGRTTAATAQVSATSDGTPAFVGIGQAVDVDRYLSGVATDVVAVGADGSVPTGLDRHPGQTLAAPPTEQTSWAVSATSASTAEVTWPVQDGTYRIVVMNADGTPGMTTQVHAAVTVPRMFGFAIGALVGGLLLTGAGVAVLVAARRRPTA